MKTAVVTTTVMCIYQPDLTVHKCTIIRSPPPPLNLMSLERKPNSSFYAAIYTLSHEAREHIHYDYTAEVTVLKRHETPEESETQSR